MVHYDGTVRNSLGDVIQFVYGEDGMDGAFIEHQKIDTFGLDNEAFEHNHRVDVADCKSGFLPNTLQIGVDDSSLELQIKLDEEYNELLNDHHLLRELIFPQADGLMPHYLPVNLHRIIQNATQIFHIDKQKSSDLEPAYIVEAGQQLDNRLAVVVGDDPLRGKFKPTHRSRFACTCAPDGGRCCS